MAIDVEDMAPAVTRAPRPSAAEEVARWFAAHRLPTPPIPDSVSAGLRQELPYVWSNEELDPWRLVDNDRAFEALARSGRTDHLTVGHVGRSTGTSRVTYQLAHRGLAVVATCFWRPEERDHDAAVIDQTFFALDALLTNLRPGLDLSRAGRPGLLVEIHGRSVRWWRPDDDPGPFPSAEEAAASWESLADVVADGRPSWRMRILDRLPAA